MLTNPLVALFEITIGVILTFGFIGHVYEAWPRIKTWLRLPGAAWVVKNTDMGDFGVDADTVLGAISDSEYRINSELWELLKDEDPAWLVAMGIKEPEYSVRAKAEAEREKAQEVNLIGKEFPAIAMLQSLGAQSYQNVDRTIEQKLEARLLAGEALKAQQAMQQSRMVQAMGLLGTIVGGPLGGQIGGAIGNGIQQQRKNDESH